MRRLLVSLGAVSLLAACSGGDDDTTPPASPSITLSSSETGGTIARGVSSTATLTLGRVNGYGGNVNFTAEGAPTGVTVTFTPATLSGAAATSSANIAVGSTAAPGTSTLTFRATGSGVTDKTVTYALTIPTPAITLTAGTGSASAAQGANTTVPITITRTGGATGGVTLTAEGLPANVTAAFSPTPIPDGSTTSTLTLTVGANATTGTFPIVVRAAATGVQDQTSTVQLTVTAAAVAGYSLTAAPAALSLNAGQPGTSTLTIARTGGFAGNVTLGLEGAPAGVAGTFTPNPATSAGNTSVLALTTTAAVVPGTYNLTVRGAAVGLTDRTITIALTVAGPPGITVALAPTTLSIAQGGNATSTVTLARVGGFTGDIAMTATGAPAGMTVAFAPASVTGANTSSVATVTVGAAVAAGTYNLTLTGTGAGNVVGNATLPVTVTVASGFTISATNVTLAQGGTTTSTITITRTGGYAGAVQLNAANTPANVNVAFSPNPATGNTSTITVTAAAGAVVGTYTVTVNATGPAATNQSTTFTIGVTASGGGGGNVNWQFCQSTGVPLWFAYRNGAAGSWTQVTPSASNTFSFTLTGATGSVAYVLPLTGGVVDGRVFLQTTAELQGNANASTSQCTAHPGTGKSLTGTFAGLAAQQHGTVTLGSASASASFPIVAYQLANVPDGAVDLLAVRSNGIVAQLGTPDRGVLRRSVNYAANSAIPVVDFAGAESFLLATATATLANVGADQTIVYQSFQSNNGNSGLIAFSLLAGSTVPIYGVPTAQLQAGDFHFLSAVAANADATSIRSFFQYNRDVANRTYTLGSVLTLPTLTTTATAPYARLKSSGAWPAEYADAGASSMTQTSRSWTMSASRGFFGTGAANYEFEVPDFTGTAGFQNSWGFVTGSPVTVSTTLFAYLVGGGGVVAEGTQFKTASRVQTQTP